MKTLLTFVLIVAISWSTAATSNVFDVDNNGEVTALTDGLLTIRFLFGFEGEALVSGAISPDATRQSPEEILSYLNANKDFFDIDGDGHSQALTDGLLLIRSQFGFSGQSLMEGALSLDARRTSETGIQQFLSAPYSWSTQFLSVLDNAGWDVLQGAEAKILQLNEPSETKNSITEIIESAGEVFGGGDIYVVFLDAGDSLPELLLSEICELVATNCSQKEIVAIASELVDLEEHGYDYRTLILGYDQLSGEPPIQLLFLEQSGSDFPNQRVVNAARGMAQLFIERQLKKSKIESTPAWWVKAQAGYLSTNFLSEALLTESIDSYFRAVSSHLRGFAANDGPVNVLEADYPEAGIAFVATLVAEFGAKHMFVNMYEPRPSSIQWHDVFETNYGETLEEAANRIASTIDENFELSKTRDPNNLADSLAAPWQTDQNSAKAHFDAGPLKKLFSLDYQQSDDCPYMLLMESYEFGDFNGDGLQDLVFTIDENNYWDQSVSNFCSAGTRVVGIYGAEKGKLPSVQIASSEALGGRDTAVTDLNLDGFDDVIVIGAGHKNETYAEDSPPISRMSFFLGSPAGLVSADDQLKNDTEFTLGDMTSEGVTVGDIDNDGRNEFLMFASMKGIGWPRALIVDCDEECRVRHPSGYEHSSHTDSYGINIYNTEVMDLDNDGLNDILFNAWIDPQYFDLESNYQRSYSNFGYTQENSSFDFSILPEELDFGFRLDGITGVIRDDGVELSPEATHYWETEMVDLDKNGQSEFVALENNQFHVEDSTFVISIYQRKSNGIGFSLAPNQPSKTGATHDQNFQFLDLDSDGDLDIVSTLKPRSSHGNTIAFHENLNPGWALSMKGYNAVFQEYNCNRIYLPDTDADGDLDLVLTCPRADSFEIYYSENRKQ
jgi:hypothetical protein